MKKITMIMALTSLATSFSLSANADVIKPINNNSAVKVVLPLPAKNYYDFTMTLDGKAVKVDEVIPVDGPKCLDFNFEVKDLGLYYTTTYCGEFQVGKTTEIKMPAVQLVGPALTPDTLFFKQAHPFKFQTANFSYLTISRLAHDFALPKLIPYLVHQTTIELAMPLKVIKVAIDPATFVFLVKNPSEERPSITFTKVGRAAFPDAVPLQVEFFRAATRWEYTSVTSLKGNFKIEKPVQMFSWLKQPWDSSDTLRICQVNPDGQECRDSYQIGGIDTFAIPLASTYPTTINVNRIDVDHVTVNAADGRVAIVPGKYSVTNVVSSFSVVRGATTQTGVDVLPGEYETTVYYRDPFTQKDETKIYKLSFN